MTRRLKRLSDFEISLQIKNDGFIRPPRDAQRNWLLNHALAEFSDNLHALDKLSAKFVHGAGDFSTEDRTQAELGDHEIMEDWQIPLMQAMAKIVTVSHGNVLEVGFGRGVSSSFIQDFGAESHTIIECNDSVLQRYDRWRVKFPDRNIHIVHGLWQDVLGQLGQFDGVFFHTYPLTESDYIDQLAESTTFAEHFFPHAAAHLVHGGIFTYLSNEIDSLSRTHQRLLFKHFQSVELSIVDSLDLPDDVKDAWWADSMVIVKAVK